MRQHRSYMLRLHAFVLSFSAFYFASVSLASAQGGRAFTGPLPELQGIRESGETVNLRELCEGQYTVLKAACLTCPEFLKSYGEIEAASVDYGPKGVKFVYFYKSLRHPELDGHVEPQTIDERLLHVAAAKEKLATQVPWIADTMEDSIRVGLQSSSQSIFLVSPEGEVVYAGARLDGSALRAALSAAVGEPEQVTAVSALDLPTIERTQRVPNADTALQVERPEGLVILSIAPTSPLVTHYVKLRAEAEPALLSSGTGRLFLGFYPDPILDAHWNNLTPPMKYTLQLPEGVTASPVEASAEQGVGNSDSQPRQFWVDIEADAVPEELTLTYHYYACTDTMCEAMSHEYTVRFEIDDNASRTYGFNRGERGRGGKGKGQNR